MVVDEWYRPSSVDVWNKPSNQIVVTNTMEIFKRKVGALWMRIKDGIRQADAALWTPTGPCRFVCYCSYFLSGSRVMPGMDRLRNIHGTARTWKTVPGPRFTFVYYSGRDTFNVIFVSL